MTKLRVGSALAGLGEAEPFEDVNHVTRFEYGKRAYRLSDKDGMGADELGNELGLPVLKQELDDLAEVGLQFIKTCALCVRSRPTGDVADVESGLWIAFDHGGIAAHTWIACDGGYENSRKMPGAQRRPR